MNEKDLENENLGSGLDDTASAEDDVKKEGGSEWQFEASAPSVENDVLTGAGGVEFEFGNDESTKPSVSVQPQVQPVSKDIVIKKEKVTVALASIIAVIVIAVLVLLGVRYYTVPNSDEKMNPGNIALTVENTDVSVGMYNYYYGRVVYEYTSYAAYGYYDLDTTADFANQYTVDNDGNEISWLDFFKQETINRIRNNTIYYELGQKAGVTLTDAQKENIEAQLDSISQAASDANMGVNEYIAQNYGANCGLATLRKFLEQYNIASGYYYQNQIKNRPSDEEVNSYLEEHKQEYESCTYALLEMNYDTTDESTKAASIETIKKYASEVTDVESMKAILPEASASVIERFIAAGYFEDTDAAVEALTETIENTQSKDDVAGNFSDEIADWLFSTDTAVGSTNYYAREENGVAYLILKTNQPFLDETEVYSVRHILVIPESAQANENGQNATVTEYTDAEWAAALDRANTIVDEYNSTDKTELSFALLAEKYSEDTESTSAGSSGLYGGGYEGTSLGQMVSEFEGWALDDARKFGDVEIVKSQFGYHIMYFIYAGPGYKYNASLNCVSEKELEFVESLDVKERVGIKSVASAKPSDSYVFSASQQY